MTDEPKRIIRWRRRGPAQLAVGVLGLGGLIATWWAGYMLAWIPIIVGTELISRALAPRDGV